MACMLNVTFAFKVDSFGPTKCPPGGRVKVEPSLLFAFFPCVIVILVQVEANPCDEANRGLVALSLVLQPFWPVLGSWNPHSPFVLF